MNKEDIVKLFREALAWGMVYGPVMSVEQWDEMREEKAENYASQIKEDEWEPLPTNLNSLEGQYWIALKGGLVIPAEYVWKQGRNPHGFDSYPFGGRFDADEVTHIKRFVIPIRPNKELKK